MRFKGLDLNLLAALDVLLSTRHVTRAAQQMNLSQAAMSSALSRLRAYFGDELLVAEGKRMYPTAYAESLAPHVRDCLRSVDTLIATSPNFEPSTTQRAFSIIASDYVIAVLLGPLAVRLAREAPNLRLETRLPDDATLQQVAQGSIDLLITPEGNARSDLQTEPLFEETYVVAGWRGNPLFTPQISEDDVLSASHVAVSIGGDLSWGDKHFEALGIARRIDVVVPTFTLAAWLLRDTRRITVMHARLAYAMAERFPIVHAPLPIALPPLREVLQFHPARKRDEGLAWLRRALHEAAIAEYNRFRE